MARRSPLNPRYQKDTGPAGKTRRSAAAVKPKREAGGRAPAAPASRKPRSSFREAIRNTPSTPEMKRWRRLWWVAVLLAFVVALATAFLPQIRANRALVIAFTVVYLASLSAALYIDIGVIRKLRGKAQTGAKQRP